jgi:hypothetical protein
MSFLLFLEGYLFKGEPCLIIIDGGKQMDKKPLIGKYVVVGIIALFLSIIPTTGSMLIEKEHPLMTKGCLDEISISGTMGENGWYVSDVTVTFTAFGNDTLYRVDGSDWEIYTGPFGVTTDGFHVVECTHDMEHIYYAFFKIDKTPPEIYLLKQRVGIHTMTFIANVYDATSGIWRVEFYLDGELQVTDYDFPFEWTWDGSGEHIVTATVFDFAGNSASSFISTPFTLSCIQNCSHHHYIIQLLLNLIVRFHNIIR